MEISQKLNVNNFEQHHSLVWIIKTEFNKEFASELLISVLLHSSSQVNN